MAMLKPLIETPKYTLMRGVARFSAVRKVVSTVKEAIGRDAAKRYEQHLLSEMGNTVFSDINPNDFLQNLTDKGCSFGLKLPKRTVDEIKYFSETNPVFAYRNEKLGFSTPEERKRIENVLGKEILLSQYFNALDHCNAIRELSSDPLLNLIALKYLGCVPTFLGVSLWWTYPITPLKEDQLKHAHCYHRDIDDFKFLKFFFYLTDVEEGDGSHWLVPGSHKKAPHVQVKDRFVTRRFEDDEITNYYGKENVLEVTGSAGTGFAEDTLCVHKASTPSIKPRLILHLQFGLFNLVPKGDRRIASELVMASNG